MFQRTSFIQDSVLLHSDRISFFNLCPLLLVLSVSTSDWGEPTPVFFTPSLKVLMNIGKTPLNLLFSRLSSPFPLSLFSLQQQEGAQAVVPAVRGALSSQQGPTTGLLPSAPSPFPSVGDSPSACPSYATASLPPPKPEWPLAFGGRRESLQPLPALCWALGGANPLFITSHSVSMGMSERCMNLALANREVTRGHGAVAGRA